MLWVCQRTQWCTGAFGPAFRACLLPSFHTPPAGVALPQRAVQQMSTHLDGTLCALGAGNRRHMSAAVELGSADALFDVGEAHARGLNGLALDPHKALACFLRAGSMVRCRARSTRLPCPSHHARCWCAVMHQGHAKSLCSAGSLLYHGSGVAQVRLQNMSCAALSIPTVHPNTTVLVWAFVAMHPTTGPYACL